MIVRRPPADLVDDVIVLERKSRAARVQRRLPWHDRQRAIRAYDALLFTLGLRGIGGLS